MIATMALPYESNRWEEDDDSQDSGNAQLESNTISSYKIRNQPNFQWGKQARSQFYGNAITRLSIYQCNLITSNLLYWIYCSDIAGCN